MENKKLSFIIPAYNWYSDSKGKSICLGEIAKCCCVGTEGTRNNEE